LSFVFLFNAFQGWWDILLALYRKFAAKSVGERILAGMGRTSSK